MVKSITTMLKNKIATLQFWWAEKTILEDKHFKYSKEVPSGRGNLVIEILKKPFNGVVVEIVDMKVSEIQDGCGMIDFSTQIMYNRFNADVTTDKFNRLVTNIVRLIFLKAVEKVEVKDFFNEDRDANIVELDEERPVSTEVSAVPQKRVSKRKPRKKTVSRDTKILPKVQQPTKSKRTKSPSGRQKRPD